MEFPKVSETIFDSKQENIQKLAQLFPDVVKDGQLDIKALQEALGDFEEVGTEKFEINWPGKRKAKEVGHEDLQGKTLNFKESYSVNSVDTRNIYIEGDNLDVLKILRHNYYQSINVIYIDPPYNKGIDYIYSDVYTMDKEEAAILEGQQSELGERYQINQKSSSRYHSTWLSMMYSRLLVAKELLKDDGVIFISIDDDELGNLIKLSNEVFGEENFIANITRNTNSSKNQAIFVSVSHDYCLIYAKNKGVLEAKHQDNKWAVPKNNVKEYKNKINELLKMGLSNDEITDELKELTKYPRFIDFVNYWYIDERGVYRKDNLGGVKNGNMNPLFNPLTNNFDPIPPGGFRYNSEKLQQLVSDNRIHFHIDGSLPTVKRYLDENLTSRPKSIMSDDQRPDNSLLKTFNTPFDNPKQLDFMTRILSIFEKDATILDFFSGSATTAHAVLKLNAEDGGERKFIMVQLQEECNKSSEAYKKGYKTICEIGQQRIIKACERIKEDYSSKEYINNLDLGFNMFEIADTNIRWTHEALKSGQITAVEAEMSDRDLLDFMPGTRDIDVVYEVMLRQRDVPLSSPVELLSEIGERTYLFAHSYVVCLEDTIIPELVEKLASIDPLPVKYILRDSAFGEDISLKEETFRRLQLLVERNTGISKKTYTVEFL